MKYVVETENGLVRGTTSKDYYNEPFYCFYGIPFAKPPIGELRFKAPELPESWEGIKDCEVVKDGCFSRHTFTTKYYGSEDCLFLNVYTKTLGANSKLPVLVWIHGGAYVTGSGNPDIFGPEFMITQNIVIVTINYRLGPLGFLCLEDESLEVPGNAGLKDVLLAMKWVNKNVQNFGGDPSNITVNGQSSGAIIVNFLMLSPLAKGLFHKAIMQSATALQNWALGKREGAKELAEVLGFKSNCEKEILKFLREVPAKELWKATQKIRILTDDRFGDNVHSFNPVIEKDGPGAMLTEPPLLTIMRGNYHKVPLLMGYTSEEGLYGIFIVKGFKVIVDDFEKMVPHTLKLPKGSELSKMTAKKIQNFFIGDEVVTQKNRFKFLHMCSSLFFAYPVYRTAKLFVKNLDHPIYYYRFSVDASLNLYKKARNYKKPGASHTDDTCYQFKTMLTPEVKPGSVEDLTIRRMVTLWGNFIRNGNPNPPKYDSLIQVDWKPLEPNVMHYVDIRNDGLVVGENPDQEVMSFWDDIYKNDPLYLNHKL